MMGESISTMILQNVRYELLLPNNIKKSCAITPIISTEASVSERSGEIKAKPHENYDYLYVKAEGREHDC